MAQKGQVLKRGKDLVKDPFVLEFLNIKENTRYLEIKNLNNLVNLFLDIAENNAERNLSMSMND